eukprot:16429192-Heterocapsa_arctica.AAC.1
MLDGQDLDEAAAILDGDLDEAAAMLDGGDLDEAAAILALDGVPDRRLGLPPRSAATAAYARQCRAALLMKSKVDILTTQLDEYDD